jgi:hypothetical protein
LLVASFAFGQSVDPSVTVAGDATLTFGIDLETGQTGFKNEATSTITLTVVPVGTETSGPEGSVSGIVELKDFRVDLSTADGTRINAGAVTAWVFVDPIEIKIFSAPTLNFDQAAAWRTFRQAAAAAPVNNVRVLPPAPTYADAGDAVFTGEVVAVAADGTVPANGVVLEANIDGDGTRLVALTSTEAAKTAAYQGFTVTVPAGDLSVALQVASLGSWVENVDNLYAAGLSVSGSVAEGVSGTLGTFVGPFGENTDSLAFGVGASLGLEIDIVSVDAATDVLYNTATEILRVDHSLGLSLDLDVAKITVNVYAYSEDATDFAYSENLLSRLTLDLGGLDEALDLVLAFETQNTFVDDGLQFVFDANAAYDIDGIKPFVNFRYLSDGPIPVLGPVEAHMNLTAGVELSLIPMTTFTLQYAGVDIADANNGAARTQFVTFATKVSF